MGTISKYRKKRYSSSVCHPRKKELIGNFYRPGTLYTQATIETWDHDFPSLAQGVVIPHGIYDLQRNHGYVTLGTSHDTSEFACDSLRQWWQTDGQALYTEADALLLLCDGGGSNSARTYLFKADLEKLVQEIGLENPGGALSTVHVQVQPDRASAVSTPDTCVSGRHLHQYRSRERLDGKNDHENRLRSHCEQSRQGLRDRTESHCHFQRADAGHL